MDIVKQIAQTDEGLEMLLNSESEYVQEAILSIGRDRKFKEKLKNFGAKGYVLLFNAENMTVEEYEELCELEPSYLEYYREYDKSVFWAIKKGYGNYFSEIFSKMKNKKRDDLI
jgi:hypothetical protein